MVIPTSGRSAFSGTMHIDTHQHTDILKINRAIELERYISVKSTYYYCKGPKLGFQKPYQVTNNPITPAPGNSNGSKGTCGLMYIPIHISIHTHSTHTYKDMYIYYMQKLK